MIRALIQMSAAQLNDKPLTSNEVQAFVDDVCQHSHTELIKGIRLLLIRKSEFSIDSINKVVKEYRKPLNRLRRFIARKFERDTLEIKMGDS